MHGSSSSRVTIETRSLKATNVECIRPTRILCWISFDGEGERAAKRVSVRLQVKVRLQRRCGCGNLDEFASVRWERTGNRAGREARLPPWLPPSTRQAGYLAGTRTCGESPSQLLEQSCHTCFEVGIGDAGTDVRVQVASSVTVRLTANEQVVGCGRPG